MTTKKLGDNVVFAAKDSLFMRMSEQWHFCYDLTPSVQKERGMETVAYKLSDWPIKQGTIFSVTQRWDWKIVTKELMFYENVEDAPLDKPIIIDTPQWLAMWMNASPEDMWI